MEKILFDFENTINDTIVKLNFITDEESQKKVFVDKWSKKEILGHLIDSSINNTVRFVNGQTKNNLIFDGYDQNLWVRVQNYQNQNWKDLIEHWKLNNVHILNIIKQVSHNRLKQNFTEHNFDKIAWKVVDKSIPVNLEYLIIDYIEHMNHHLNQIFS